MTLTHRPATEADVQLYFDWANDPLTRQQSFQSDFIPFETHQHWFTRKLCDPNTLLLVFEESTQPVGQTRFERTDAGEALISLSVDTRFRGRGLANKVITRGIAACRAVWGPVPVRAYIRPDNAASVRAFGRAGFVFSHQTLVADVLAHVYHQTVQSV